MLHKGIETEKLVFEEHIIGTESKTRVAVVYINDITNSLHINTSSQSLFDLDIDLDIDVVFDSSFLDQIITDNSNTPFPLFVTSERVDRIKYALISVNLSLYDYSQPQ